MTGQPLICDCLITDSSRIHHWQLFPVSGCLRSLEILERTSQQSVIEANLLLEQSRSLWGHRNCSWDNNRPREFSRLKGCSTSRRGKKRVRQTMTIFKFTFEGSFTTCHLSSILSLFCCRSSSNIKTKENISSWVIRKCALRDLFVVDVIGRFFSCILKIIFVQKSFTWITEFSIKNYYCISWNRSWSNKSSYSIIP